MSGAWQAGLGIAGYAAYYMAMLLSVLLIPIGVPGHFLVAGATLILALVAGRDVMPWWAVALLFGLALSAEGMEAVAGYFGARRAKGSRRSALAAVAGGIAGALLGASVGLFIGAFVGALAGTFAGAFLAEYSQTRERTHAGTVALGAVLGRLAGLFAKTLTALIMVGVATAVLIARR